MESTAPLCLPARCGFNADHLGQVRPDVEGGVHGAASQRTGSARGELPVSAGSWTPEALLRGTLPQTQRSPRPATLASGGNSPWAALTCPLTGHTDDDALPPKRPLNLGKVTQRK